MLCGEESKHGSPCFPALQTQDELSKAACTGKQKGLSEREKLVLSLQIART